MPMIITYTYSKEFLFALAIQTWADIISTERISAADYEALMSEEVREIDIETVYEEMA